MSRISLVQPFTKVLQDRWAFHPSLTYRALSELKIKKPIGNRRSQAYKKTFFVPSACPAKVAEACPAIFTSSKVTKNVSQPPLTYFALSEL